MFASLLAASLFAPVHAEPADEPPVQMAFHGGLLQPLLLSGFNAAVDVRTERLIVSYSHGEGLELTDVPGTLPADQLAAGTRVLEPWTTGFGVGARLVNELYVMADFKVHGFEVLTDLDSANYTTMTVGAEVGYRVFLWEGLYVCPVIRYWPDVWSSAPEGFALASSAGTYQHDPLSQGYNGLFANVLVGWAFDVRGASVPSALIGARR